MESSDREGVDNVLLKYTRTILSKKRKLPSAKYYAHYDSSSDEEWDEFLFSNIFSKVKKARTLCLKPLHEKHRKGEFHTTYVSLRQCPNKFKEYFRMQIETFDYILEKIRKDITKYSSRPSFAPEERLAVTLRFLATGSSFRSLAQLYKMHNYSVCLIVSEVCKAIYERLLVHHMCMPTPDEFKVIAEEFERDRQFPNVIGAVNGKHIRVKCPEKSGTRFYNSKQHFSIILQAVADTKYRFIFTDVVGYNQQNDGGIYQASTLSKFVDNTENFPDARIIEGIDEPLPYFLIGDEAYPLKRNLMKPFSKKSLSNEEVNFNVRLSRVRQCVEYAFGIMAGKWKILLKAIETEPSKAVDIVKCIAVLHNVIIDLEGSDCKFLSRVHQKVIQRNGNNLIGLFKSRVNNRSTVQATHVRKLLTEYVNGPVGSIPFQQEYLNDKQC